MGSAPNERSSPPRFLHCFCHFLCLAWCWMPPPVLRQVLGQPTLCPPQGLLTASTSLDSGTQGRLLPSCSVLLSPSVTWNHHFLTILLLFARSCPAFPSPSQKWHLERMWGCYLEPQISKAYDPPKKKK